MTSDGRFYRCVACNGNNAAVTGLGHENNDGRISRARAEIRDAFEENPKLKADFEQQSAAYRKLAAAGLEATDLKPREAQ